MGDADFRKAAHQRLVQMVGAARIVVLASHDLSLIRRYCNKVVRMEAGAVSPLMDVSELGPEPARDSEDPPYRQLPAAE